MSRCSPWSTILIPLRSDVKWQRHNELLTISTCKFMEFVRIFGAIVMQ